MAAEEVEVVISSTGEVTMKVKGIAGTACLTATAALEAALGGEILHREMTQEAYEQEQSSQETRQWTGRSG
jgi:hypothetical protein